MTQKASKKKSSYLRLKSRIARDIGKGKLLCDIKLTDTEYMSLAAHVAKCIGGRYPVSGSNPAIAVFLVASGIRYYDGSYWDHIAAVCGQEIPYKVQLALGDAFYAFAKKNSMPVFQQSDRVKNIMAHCFLPDAFRYDFYSFIFYYYFVDLKCDLSALPSGSAADFSEPAASAENTERMYMITRGTRDFMTLYPEQSRKKLRRMLGIIDRVYKLEPLPKRLSASEKTLAEWCDRDETFRREAKSGNFSEKVHKDDAFSSPFTVNEDGKMYIWLPSVIFRRNDDALSEKPVWYLNGEALISPALTVSISGCQTEVIRVTLDSAPAKGSVVSIIYGETVKSWTL